MTSFFGEQERGEATFDLVWSSPGDLVQGLTIKKQLHKSDRNRLKFNTV